MSRPTRDEGWAALEGQQPTVAPTRSHPSPRYGSGQQCCYTASGMQLLTSDSTSGSTPDRGHDWGAPPYRTPPRVPGMSHWLYDVISFYYCCLWAPECSRYMRRRPSSDCRSYRPPRLGGCWPGCLTTEGRAILGRKGHRNLPDPPLSLQPLPLGTPILSPSMAPASRSAGRASMCCWSPR